MTRYTPLLLVAVLPMVGCVPVLFQSDEGFVEFRTPPEEEGADPIPSVHADPFYGFSNEGPILEGTTICWKTQPTAELPEGAWPDCFDITLAGGVTEDGDCFTFGGTDATVTYAPAATCDAAAIEDLFTDSLTFRVVAADSLEVELLRFGEMAAGRGALEADAGPWPEAWPAPFEPPLRVVAGQPVLVEVGLYHPDFDAPAAFNDEGATLTVETVTGDAPEVLPLFDDPESEPDVGPFSPGQRMVLAEDSSAQLRLDVGAASWTSGEVVAVPQSEIVELEVVGAYFANFSGTELPGSPAGARAIGRDADGNPVLGADVQWSLRGAELQMVPGSQPGPVSLFPLAGDDYVWLYDGCIAPGERVGTHTATLKASLGGLSDSVKFTWERLEADADPEWVKPDHCTSGCSGCSASAEGSQAALGMLLLVAGLARRRVRRVGVGG